MQKKKTEEVKKCKVKKKQRVNFVHIKCCSIRKEGKMCILHFAFWHLAFCYLAYKVLHSIFHINFILDRGGGGAG